MAAAKRAGGAQIENRGYAVRKMAERLGGSTKLAHRWLRQFSQPAKLIPEVNAQTDDARRLKRDLARGPEKREFAKAALSRGTPPYCDVYTQRAKFAP